MQSKQLAKSLEAFGCTETEARIYLQLLVSGASSVQEISKSLGASRTTIHSAVQQLITKGLLFESRRGKRRLILAEEPEVFYKLLDQKSAELQMMHSGMIPLIQQLNSIQRLESHRPSVQYYEDVSGFKRMLEETLTARDEVYVFTYVDLFSKLVDPEYLEDYFVRRAKKNIHTRLIFPPVDFAKRVNQKAREYKIQVRLLPEGLVWESGIFSWNNSVALMSFTMSKLTCTIIENADIAKFYQRIIFELCWQQAQSMRS